jgi:CubicO group peptidase (beta-lactamase class C family)
MMDSAFGVAEAKRARLAEPFEKPRRAETVLGASTYTFGLGFAVWPGDGLAPFPGSAGDFNWGGYAGTFFGSIPRSSWWRP